MNELLSTVSFVHPALAACVFNHRKLGSVCYAVLLVVVTCGKTSDMAGRRHRIVGSLQLVV